jgi:hypothetical protein
MMHIDHYYSLIGHSNLIAEGYEIEDEDAPYADETQYLYCIKKGIVMQKYRLHDRILFFEMNVNN